MEPLPGSWTSGAQVASAVVLAVFFLQLRRATRRPELQWWVRAWIANVIALVAGLAAAVHAPAAAAPGLLLRAVYLAGCAAFAMNVVQGSWMLARPGAAGLRHAWRWAMIVGYAGIGAAVLETPDGIGAAVHLPLGVLLVLATVVLARASRPGAEWLAAGLGARAMLALAEGGAHFLRGLPAGIIPAGSGDGLGVLIAGHAAFDGLADWMVALGCVLAVWNRVDGELQSVNQELLRAQEALRRLVDRDPLTGLANRRSLPAIFRRVFDTGATLLFFDLDEFKVLNDTRGHRVGDECLRRFAHVLRDCFRPEDAIVRYGGDEFLVIAAGLDEEGAAERTEAVRARLRAAPGALPPIGFSVGVHRLAPFEDAEVALRAADAAMYRAKAHLAPMGLGGLA